MAEGNTVTDTHQTHTNNSDGFVSFSRTPSTSDRSSRFNTYANSQRFLLVHWFVFCCRLLPIRLYDSYRFEFQKAASSGELKKNLLSFFRPLTREPINGWTMQPTLVTPWKVGSKNLNNSVLRINRNQNDKKKRETLEKRNGKVARRVALNIIDEMYESGDHIWSSCCWSAKP